MVSVAIILFIGYVVESLFLPLLIILLQRKGVSGVQR